MPSKIAKNLIMAVGACVVLILLFGYIDLRYFAIWTNDIDSDEERIRSPLVSSIFMASTCILATSRTSIIANFKSGSMGSLPLRIRSTSEIDDPKFLSRGAPRTSTGLIVVSAISGASLFT